MNPGRCEGGDKSFSGRYGVELDPTVLQSCSPPLTINQKWEKLEFKKQKVKKQMQKDPQLADYVPHVGSFQRRFSCLHKGGEV